MIETTPTTEQDLHFGRIAAPCVASYRSAHAAALAVHHLDEAGFAPDDVVITPAELQPLPGWWRRLRPARHRPAVVASGVLAAVVVGLLLAAATPFSVTTIALIAVLAGAVTAGLGVSLDEQHAAWVRRHAEAERRVVARRFDVRCRCEPHRAEHVLAGWWDPTAPPVRHD